MYSKELTIALQEQTTLYLNTNVDVVKNEVDIELLRNILRLHEYRYYILNDPLIADGEYDQLYKLLERTEIKNPDWILPIRPPSVLPKNLRVALIRCNIWFLCCL